MSGRELQRVEVLARVRSKQLRIVDASRLMQVSYRLFPLDNLLINWYIGSCKRDLSGRATARWLFVFMGAKERRI